MSNLIEHKKFVAASAEGNNARFWEYKFYDNDTVVVIYGRLGVTRNEEPPKSMTRAKLTTLVRNKTKATKDRPAYQEVPTVGDSVVAGAGQKVSDIQLKEIAKKELAGADPVLIDLVTRLAEANKHELIASTNGAMNIDTSTGIVSTEMGVITLDSINKARVLLGDMSPFVVKKDHDDKTFMQMISDYMMLVPQRVGMNRGWHRTFLYDTSKLQQQNTLLDQLETSVQLVTQRMADAEKALADGVNAPAQPALFSTKVSVVTDKQIIADVEAFFNKGINRSHTSSGLRPIRIYQVEIESVRSGYETFGKLIGNTRRLWHGTRTFNVLSMLKRGPIIPPKTGGGFHVTGRMFGDGFYMSDQATKSLNYSQGYWSGARDNNCFMFLCEAAMGKVYQPHSSGDAQKSGYDSCFAEAGKSGVANNEMIVYDTRQVDIQYLVEFSDR